MRVITVARKPLGGTVAQNVEKWGTGGLNIDGCRIGIEARYNPAAGNQPGGSSYNMSEYGMPSDAEGAWAEGRWPANVILEHLPECRCQGTKRVKGSPTSKTFHGAYEGESITGLLRGVSHPGNQHADADGMETIEAWACVEGCSVAHLDNTPTSTTGVRQNTRRIQDEVGVTPFTRGVEAPEYTDSGGASRFFKQIQSESCE